MKKFLTFILTIWSFSSFASDSIWERACQPNEKGGGSQKVLKFEGDVLTHTFFGFFDADCKNPTIELAAVTKFLIGEIQNDHNAFLDLTWQANLVTPRHEAVTKLLNAQQFLGYTDWQTDIAKNILRTDCNHGSCNAQKIFTLIHVENKQLMLGITDDAHDGKTQETRAVNVNTEEIYTKRQ